MKVYRVHKPWNGPATIVSAEVEKEGTRFWTLKEPIEGFWKTKVDKDALFLSAEEALMAYMGRLSERLKV